MGRLVLTIHCPECGSRQEDDADTCATCGTNLLDRLLILEPRGEVDEPDDGSSVAVWKHRRHTAVGVTIVATVSLIWAGLAMWPTTSTAITIALYQAGGPDTVRVQRLGAKPGPTFRHPELQGDGAIAGPVLIGRSLVVVRGDAIWALASARAPAHRLTAGCRVLPSVDADRMWVGSCGDPVRVRAFDLAGHALSGYLDLPAGYDNPLSMTSEGVALLASSSTPHPAVVVWDRRAGRDVGATDLRVIPVSPDLAVTQTIESPPYATFLFDVRSQQSARVAVPAGTTILSGTLSPDGRTIAVVMSNGLDTASPDTELGVIDVLRRTLRVVDNSMTEDGYWELEWSKKGDRLVAGDGQPRPGLLARISVYDLARGSAQRWSFTGGPFTGFVVI